MPVTECPWCAKVAWDGEQCSACGDDPLTMARRVVALVRGESMAPGYEWMGTGGQFGIQQVAPIAQALVNILDPAVEGPSLRDLLRAVDAIKPATITFKGEES